MFSHGKKAGLSGLFLCSVMALTGWCQASADPVTIEIASADAGVDERTKQPIITYRIGEASRRLFADLTANRVGKMMHLKLDGRVVISSVIREPLLLGSVQITGLTAEQAKDIAAQLSSGKARVEFEIAPD